MITNIAIIVLSIGMIKLAVVVRENYEKHKRVSLLEVERSDLAIKEMTDINTRISAITTYLNAHFEEKKEIETIREHWYSDDTDIIKITTILVKNKK